MKKNRRGKCIWTLDNDEWNAYNTACQDMFYISEGTPKENHIKYCPMCGKIIKET